MSWGGLQRATQLGELRDLYIHTANRLFIFLNILGYMVFVDGIFTKSFKKKLNVINLTEINRLYFIFFKEYEYLILCF